MKLWLYIVLFLAIMGATNNFSTLPTLPGLFMYVTGGWLTLYLPVHVIYILFFERRNVE
jgi:hypothetical protein